jgi:hypothetical protein
MMKVLVASLLAVAGADSHDKITKEEFNSESQGKWVFLDMYAEW